MGACRLPRKSCPRRGAWIGIRLVACKDFLRPGVWAGWRESRVEAVGDVDVADGLQGMEGCSVSGLMQSIPYSRLSLVSGFAIESIFSKKLQSDNRAGFEKVGRSLEAGAIERE